jgi:hypothetical protein
VSLVVITERCRAWHLLVFGVTWLCVIKRKSSLLLPDSELAILGCFEYAHETVFYYKLHLKNSHLELVGVLSDQWTTHNSHVGNVLPGSLPIRTIQS